MSGKNTYADADEKLSAVLRQISWMNNLIIMTRAKSLEEWALLQQEMRKICDDPLSMDDEQERRIEL